MSTNLSTSIRSLLLLLTFALGSASSLAGCHLYFGDEDDRQVDPPWPDDCWDCQSEFPDAGIGWECETSNDCAEGCYCSDANWCEETGFCDAWTACADGFECDDRSTCVPTPEPTLSCQGEVTCDAAAPICPVASTPAIEGGCYTGACIAKSECPDGAPFACSDFNEFEDTCIASPLCNPVYKGVNCTSDTGASCTAGSESCTCESFELDRCEAL